MANLTGTLSSAWAFQRSIHAPRRAHGPISLQSPIERKAEEVWKELVRGGYLHDEPAVVLVAEVLSDVEAGE
jgi:hypothetical protein